MSMIAEVIVDVTARDIDRPFDYVIPIEFESLVQVGMRVQVSFGPRTILGFVLGVKSIEDPERLRALKPLQDVLDLVPVFDAHLIELAKWMQTRYVCSLSSALQVMLPGALRAQAYTTIRFSESFLAECKSSGKIIGEQFVADCFGSEEEVALAQWLYQKHVLSLDAVHKTYPTALKWLKKWRQNAWIIEVSHVKDRVQSKTIDWMEPLVDVAALEAYLSTLNKRATAQQRLVHMLIANWHTRPVAEVLAESGVARAQLKPLEEHGLIRIRAVETYRDPYAHKDFQADQAKTLTTDQQHALDEIIGAMNDQEATCAFLLEGVTGSGKTEVYLQAIAHALEYGKEALMLVPEISLTPQMVERFKRRFGAQVAVIHSRLSQGERLDEWRKIANGHVKVTVGARSALFAPFHRLGLIILDEEHESSYKQEESPRYHAREVALARAMMLGIPVVYGSATPSLELEAWASAEGVWPSGALQPARRLRLPQRVHGQAMPAVEVIDLREELREGHRSMISRRLHQAIQERLERKEQIVLMLNRRGYASFVLCRGCGHTLECPNCDVSLTFHQMQNQCRCHFCGYAQQNVTVCPSCQSPHIRQFGAGTQKVEEELYKLFQGIRVIRMDLDTTSEKGAHEKLLDAFGAQQADVLLGTQMVAKGLDFPEVTLVGVISADTMLRVPDFRSSERTFHLLTQVAGRAGRHQKPGEVIIQTYTPEHYAVTYAAGHDVRGFLDREKVERHKMGYPPYRELTVVQFSHEQPSVVQEVANKWLEVMRGLLENEIRSGNVHLYGPVAPQMARLQNRYRLQGMIKYNGVMQMQDVIRAAQEAMADRVRKHRVQVSIDLLPLHFG